MLFGGEHMKKICAVIIAVFLILNTFNICYANEGSFVNDAVLSVQSKINIPENYTEFNSKMSVGDDVFAYFTWYGDSDGTNSGGKISVTVNKDLEITEFTQYFYGEFEGDYKLSSFTRKYALAVATDFVRSVFPDKINSVFIADEPDVTNRNFMPYEFMFYRLENGLPCFENYIYVSVNAHNGQVAVMNLVWDDCNAIRPAKAGISADEAKVAMFDKIGMVSEYAKRPDGSLYIRYKDLSDNRYYVNAYNGSLLDKGFVQSSPFVSKSFDLSYADECDLSLCIGSVMENKYIPFDQSFSLSNITFCADDFSNYVILEYVNEKSHIKTYIVDTANADIKYYYEQISVIDVNKAYSEEYCRSVADSFFEEYEKGSYGHCRYLNSAVVKNADGDKFYYFNYPRFINGIAYNDNGVVIGVSAATGRVVSVDMEMDVITQIPVVSTLEKGDAFETYVENSGFGLMYVITRSGNKKYMSAVYAPDPRHELYVNATTGELVYEDSSLYKGGYNGYNDIQNDVANTQINTLLSCGVFDKTESFYPDENIRLKDFLLYMCRGIDCVSYPDFESVRSKLLQSGIVDEKLINENGFVTTELGIKYIVSYLGYGDIAKLQNTYKTGFIDESFISDGLVGYAAIAKGLNIFTGNVFMPQQFLKRNVVAQIFYNLING